MTPSLSLRPALLRLALGLLLAATPAAFAQSAKIFVASTGDDTATGARNAPMRTFQAAHDAVAAGGEIVVLDTAGYGTLSIAKSVTITVPPGVNGFVTTTDPNTDAITIDAGSTDVVALRGLVIENVGGINNGNGIIVLSLGTLRVEDCTIRGYTFGISYQSVNPSHLVVRGGSVRDGVVGIYLASFLSTQDAVVTGCRVDGMTNVAYSSYSGGTDALGTMTLTRCLATNCQTGLGATNAGATIYAEGCTLSRDTTALDAEGGALVTRGDNTFTNNASNGSFTATLAAK